MVFLLVLFRWPPGMSWWQQAREYPKAGCGDSPRLRIVRTKMGSQSVVVRFATGQTKMEILQTIKVERADNMKLLSICMAA